MGTFEVCCGVLMLLGLLVRLAALPLLVIMGVALATTKRALLLDQGFWELLHGSRTDWSMLLGSLLLLWLGAGPWSLDSWLMRRMGGHTTE